MKRYLCLIAAFCSFILGYLFLADDAARCFVDDSSQVDSSSFMGENLQNQTDTQFVGANSTQAQNTDFAGDSYQQQVGNSTIQPFAGDNSFSGENYGQ